MAGLSGNEFKPLLGLANDGQLVLRMNPEEFTKSLKACDEFVREMSELAREAQTIAQDPHFGLGEQVLMACEGMVWNLRAFAEETCDKFEKHAQNGRDAKQLLGSIRDRTLMRDHDWAAGYKKLMQES